MARRSRPADRGLITIKGITLSNCYNTYCQVVICVTPIECFRHSFFGGNAWSECLVLATLCRDGAGTEAVGLALGRGGCEIGPGRHATRCPVPQRSPRRAFRPAAHGRRKDRIVTAPEAAPSQAP